MFLQELDSRCWWVGRGESRCEDMCWVMGVRKSVMLFWRVWDGSVNTEMGDRDIWDTPVELVCSSRSRRCHS